MSALSTTEKFEFLTDIITSYDGHEQRIKTRKIPRHFLSYDFIAMDAYQAQWLRGLIRMRQDTTMYVPMWHTPGMLVEDCRAGSRVFYLRNEDMFSFRETEYVAAYKKDVNLYDVTLGIDNKNTYRSIRGYYTPNIVSLYEAFQSTLDRRNTWMYPLRKCSIQPTQSLNYVYSNGTNIVVNFEDIMEESIVNIPDSIEFYWQENKFLNPWNLPLIVDDRLSLPLTPQWLNDDDLQLAVSKNVTRMDNQTGVFRYKLHNSKSYDTQTMEFYLMNREMINNIIRFFLNVGGRFHAFYIPTWVNDFNIALDINGSSNFIYVRFTNLYAFYGHNTRHKKIVLFCKGRKTFISDIISYTYETIDGRDYGRITISQPFGEDIPKDRILMASYMNRVRLDDDSMQLNYESDQVARTTFVMKEVDD